MFQICHRHIGLDRDTNSWWWSYLFDSLKSNSWPYWELPALFIYLNICIKFLRVFNGCKKVSRNSSHLTKGKVTISPENIHRERIHLKARVQWASSTKALVSYTTSPLSFRQYKAKVDQIQWFFWFTMELLTKRERQGVCILSGHICSHVC